MLHELAPCIVLFSCNKKKVVCICLPGLTKLANARRNSSTKAAFCLTAIQRVQVLNYLQFLSHCFLSAAAAVQDTFDSNAKTNCQQQPIYLIYKLFELQRAQLQNSAGYLCMLFCFPAVGALLLLLCFWYCCKICVWKNKHSTIQFVLKQTLLLS